MFGDSLRFERDTELYIDYKEAEEECSQESTTEN